MAISIQTNVNSMIAQDNMRLTSDLQGKTIQRLTSGYRINSSADDAAGLAVANKFRSDVTELTQGVRNANDGLSHLQIMDGGITNISKMLDRMKTLATQSASTTFTGSRATLDAEFTTLRNEINRQAADIGLSNEGGAGANAGKYAVAMSVYVGGGNTAGNSAVAFDLSTAQVNGTALGLASQQIDGAANVDTPDAGSPDLNASGAVFLAGGAQVIHFTNIGAANKSVDVTVAGGTDGLTGKQVLESINAQLKPYDIVASTDGSGKLTYSSGGDFSVQADARTVAGTAIMATDASARNSAATGASGPNRATAALSAINTAVQTLGTIQGKIGTAQNQLSYAIQLAQSQITNFSAAESRIRDADVASEAANLTKAQVLQQASIAAMAQANSAPQAVLSLLRG